jgi:hypothetical protein
MPKVRKMKEIESEIKVTETAKETSDLEEEIAEAELESFAGFIQGLEEGRIAPVLPQGGIPQAAGDAVTITNRGDNSDLDPGAQVQVSYEGASALYGPGSETSTRTYDPSIRASTSAGMITPEAAQSRFMNSSIGGPAALGQNQGMDSRQIEPERRERYEEKDRRGAQEGG